MEILRGAKANMCAYTDFAAHCTTCTISFNHYETCLSQNLAATTEVSKLPEGATYIICCHISLLQNKLRTT